MAVSYFRSGQRGTAPASRALVALCAWWGPQSFSAHSIRTMPARCERAPKVINFRPILIAADFGQARSHDFRRLSGDECFVFCTSQSFLVVLLHGLTNRVCNVCRDALDLLPAQPLDCGVRKPY